MSIEIREAIEKDIPLLAFLIRNSFRDVADRFELNPENSPSHPSNCTDEWIKTALAKGVQYFILERNLRPRGCVALEQAGDEVCYMERLAVLPEYRNMGFGSLLVRHALREARDRGAGRVEIGIIAAHIELKDWYERLGFHLRNTAEFDHLPFEVAFMFKECAGPQSG
jgi:N-acetylglutamate synthase-like GNAT family acetyltransferase